MFFTWNPGLSHEAIFFSLVSVGEREGDERKGKKQKIHCPNIIRDGLKLICK